MDDNSRIRGVYTVCKFIVNTDQEKSRNRIITKTLGKFGVINMDYKGPCPKHDELWLVKIDKEIKCNEAIGCLVLTPIYSIPVEKVFPLIPGTQCSTEYIENGVCYVIPNNREKYYMVPIGYRKAKGQGARFTICVYRGFGDKAEQETPAIQVPEPTSTNPYVNIQPESITGWTPETAKHYAESKTTTQPQSGE